MRSQIVTHSHNGNVNYLADGAYLAIKPETTAGTAVIPTIFVPLVSESVKTVVNHQVDRRMKGIDWKGTDLLRGNRTHEGDITVLCDPSTIGHLLNMVMTKGSTTGSAPTYTHPYTVGTPKSYTIEFKKGFYAQRYFGVFAEQIKFDFTDGQMTATLSIKAMGQVGIMSVGVATSGSVTSLSLDDEYDLNPNSGLVTNDVLRTGSTDLTLTSVAAGGAAVGFGSLSLTSAVGDIVYLKPQAVTLPTLTDPFYLGNLLAGFGADASAAATAAGSRATATPLYDLSIVMKNNLFAQNGSSRLDPVTIMQGTKECQLSIKQLFSDGAQRQKFLERKKQALVLVFWGKYTNTAMSAQEKLTLTFNNVKLIDDSNEIKVGEYIMDDESFEAVYDGGDSAAMSASLINSSAGTIY